jgi:hypothetical protein
MKFGAYRKALELFDAVARDMEELAFIAILSASILSLRAAETARNPES